jgi:hypothetical protein
VATTDFDVVIAGTKAKILQGEGGGFQQRYVRQEISNNLLGQSENPAMQSRGDRASLYQTSWAEGARWWKPLITPTDLSSYFQSNHMDTWSEPGKIVPTNTVADASNTVLHDNAVAAVGASGVLYAVGFTEAASTGFFDAYIWTPASNAFVVDTGQSTGVDDDDNPLAMVYDPSDGYFYIITDDPEICRFNPTTNASNAAYISTGHFGYLGSNIFLHNQELMFYDGQSTFLIDKSTTSVTEVFDDGMGPDFLSDLSFAGSAPLFRKNLHLAISTPEGIYYVKNTRQGPQPVAFIYRVDRDSAGNYIGNPIATLPQGSVALSIAYHLGSIVITASPDWQVIVKNDTTEAEIVLYHVTQGSMGSLGSLLGGRTALDETPYAILGSDGALLYIGGQKRLWIWDAVRGGLHTAWTWDTELSDGAYVTMANVLDNASVGAQIFFGKDRIARIKNDLANNPDTVTNFGDDETFYTLESNYFDFGLPMESKELSKVAIIRTAAGGSQEYTVQISADDAAFADIITHSTTSEVYEEAALSGTSGIKFRYKIIYQTKNTVRNALEALLISANAGENVQEIEMVLDGSELLNVDNTLQDEEAFYDALVAVAGTETQINFSNNMKEQGRLTDTATTVKMKVIACEIMKTKAGESAIRVVLREP